MKMDFYIKLAQNNYTRTILEDLEKTDLDNDFSSEIMELTNILTLRTGISLIEACLLTKYLNQVDIKTSKINNPTVEEIRKVFNIKERNEIPDRLFELTRFDRRFLP